jgi:AraC-like DNA-binding protein
VLVHQAAIRDPEGKIIGLIGFSRDVRAPVNPDDISPGLASAVESFEKDLSEPMTPSGLARRAKLAPSKLARIIRRFFDLTPSQFITRTRLEVASRLLLA